MYQANQNWRHCTKFLTSIPQNSQGQLMGSPQCSWQWSRNPVGNYWLSRGHLQKSLFQSREQQIRNIAMTPKRAEAIISRAAVAERHDINRVSFRKIIETFSNLTFSNVIVSFCVKFLYVLTDSWKFHRHSLVSC